MEVETYPCSEVCCDSVQSGTYCGVTMDSGQIFVLHLQPPPGCQPYRASIAPSTTQKPLSTDGPSGSSQGVEGGNGDSDSENKGSGAKSNSSWEGFLCVWTSQQSCVKIDTQTILSLGTRGRKHERAPYMKNIPTKELSKEEVKHEACFSLG